MRYSNGSGRNQAIQPLKRIRQKAPATVTVSPSVTENGNDTEVLDYRHAFYLAAVRGTEALDLQDHIWIGMEVDAIVLSAGIPTDRIGSSLPLSQVQRQWSRWRLARIRLARTVAEARLGVRRATPQGTATS
jgi:hypothetical protein